jgi:hypothetical protein
VNDPITATPQILGTCLWFDIENCDCIIHIKRTNTIPSTYPNTLFQQLQIRGKFKNIFLLIFDTCELNSSSDMDIQHSKVIFTNSKIKVLPVSTSARYISGFASEIFIDSSSKLCSGNGWTEITSELDTSFFKFNECQVTILSNYVQNTLLSNVSSDVTSEPDATAIITSSNEDNIWRYTSAFVNGDYNYYNFINHMHYASSINHDFESDDKTKIPAGTLIMYPMCFKAVKESANNNWNLSALISCPANWKILSDNSNLSEILSKTQTIDAPTEFTNWITDGLTGGFNKTIFSGEYDEEEKEFGKRCIFDLLNQLFIYQYPELRYDSLLNKTAQFTAYVDTKIETNEININGQSCSAAIYTNYGTSNPANVVYRIQTDDADFINFVSGKQLYNRITSSSIRNIQILQKALVVGDSSGAKSDTQLSYKYKIGKNAVVNGGTICSFYNDSSHASMSQTVASNEVLSYYTNNIFTTLEWNNKSWLYENSFKFELDCFGRGQRWRIYSSFRYFRLLYTKYKHCYSIFTIIRKWKFTTV